MRQRLKWKVYQYLNHRWGTHFMESESEFKFWKLAKKNGMKLKIQRHYLNYRIDFVYSNRVAIEIDGYYHKFTKQSDSVKDGILEQRYRVVRIPAAWLYNKKGIKRVIKIIEQIKRSYK